MTQPLKEKKKHTASLKMNFSTAKSTMERKPLPETRYLNQSFIISLKLEINTLTITLYIIFLNWKGNRSERLLVEAMKKIDKLGEERLNVK